MNELIFDIFLIFITFMCIFNLPPTFAGGFEYFLLLGLSPRAYGSSL